jgi:hypothetical protein
MKKEYKIRITETLARTVTVEAEGMAQAKEIAERKWKDGEYILGADDFKGAAFTPIQNRNYER